MRVGDELMLFPGRGSARIRAMQSHEREIEHAGPGRRLALNLSGIDRSDATRGTMLGLSGQWELSARFTARVAVARYVGDLTPRGAFHLHLGSGAYPADIKRLEGGYALIQLRAALPIRSGDRFILRDTGRRQVVAGGIVLDPGPGPSTAAMRAARVIDPSAGPDHVAEQLLGLRGIEDLGRLTAHSGGGRPQTAVVVGEVALSGDRFDEIRSRAERVVAQYHEQHPLRPGIPLATLAGALGVSPELAERIVAESSILQRVGPDVAAHRRQPGLDPASQEAWKKARDRLGESLAVPSVSELGLGGEVRHLLIREGLLTQVSNDLVFLPEQIEEIEGLIREMTTPFTVADFRDRTGLSRKYAVPLLEWADREGLTFRRGDLRHLR
jgi:selenocysteine-specific elongation factor